MAEPTLAEKVLVLNVERQMMFGTSDPVTITTRGHCPNLCDGRLKYTSGNGYLEYECRACGYHARLVNSIGSLVGTE